MSGSIKEMVNIKHLSERAKAYGIPGVTIDGNDVIKVAETTAEAVERARRGEGPTLIEAETYRWRGHSRSDARKYRTREEEKYWRNEKIRLGFLKTVCWKKRSLQKKRTTKWRKSTRRD